MSLERVHTNCPLNGKRLRRKTLFCRQVCTVYVHILKVIEMVIYKTLLQLCGGGEFQPHFRNFTLSPTGNIIR